MKLSEIIKALQDSVESDTDCKIAFYDHEVIEVLLSTPDESEKYRRLIINLGKSVANPHP